MERDLAEEYMGLIKAAKKNKKENRALYPIYKQSNMLLKSIKSIQELRLDAFLSDEIIGEESKRIFLQCSNRITINSYIDLVAANFSAHSLLSHAQYRGALFPPVLALEGLISRVPRKQKKQKTEKGQEKPEEKPGTTEEMDAPKEIKKIFSVLKEKKEVELYRLVIDPKSFGKTVENILTLAFAVKVGRAFIAERENVLYATLEKTESFRDLHCILGITEEDIQKIAKEMNIVDSLL